MTIPKTPFEIETLELAQVSNHSDIEKPNVFVRAKNMLLGRVGKIEQLNKDAQIEYLTSGPEYLGKHYDVLKITPRVGFRNELSYKAWGDVQAYIAELLSEIGFEAYHPNDNAEKCRAAMFIDLRNKKNAQLIKKIGHMLNYDYSAPLRQEFINNIFKNNLMR